MDNMYIYYVTFCEEDNPNTILTRTGITHGTSYADALKHCVDYFGELYVLKITLEYLKDSDLCFIKENQLEDILKINQEED